MSLTSGCARSVGRVSFWVCIGQPIGIQPNRLCRNRSNYISASWRCPGIIRAMATGVFVPYWRRRAGRLVASKSSASDAQKGSKSVLNPSAFLGKAISTGLPTHATHRNHVWTWDFIFDRTDKGSTLKMLTMLDEYTRQCVAIRVERQIRSEQVLATLWQAMTTYGIPQHIRSDNGSEFIAQKIQHWLRENKIKTLYIDPGSPWQNGYIESFHSRFRDECLNREWLLNLHEARVVIEDWRRHYNTERPHSRLGYLSPEDYIKGEKVSS